MWKLDFVVWISQPFPAVVFAFGVLDVATSEQFLKKSYENHEDFLPDTRVVEVAVRFGPLWQCLELKKEGIVRAGCRTDLSSAPVMWTEVAQARRMCWMWMTQLWRRHVTLRAIDRKERGAGRRAVDSCRQSATPLTFLCKRNYRPLGSKSRDGGNWRREGQWASLPCLRLILSLLMSFSFVLLHLGQMTSPCLTTCFSTASA